MSANRERTVLIAVLILAAAVISYLPALGAGFIWDDDSYIEDNSTLTTLSGLARIWLEPTSIPQYYPLVHTTYWLEYRLWGLSPFGYHLVNLILHLTSCGLLFVLVRRLALPGALLVSGVFALHPVMVESVAWVTERKNVLSMVFYLSSALVYLRWAGLGEGLKNPKPAGIKIWWMAFGLFLCALTSKSVTFSLPFALLLLVYWKRGAVRLADIKPLVPFMIVGIAYGVFTSHLEHTHVGAHGPEFQASFLDKCLIAGRTPWFYLWKLAWPERLVFIYERWDIDALQFWQWGFPVATLMLVCALVAFRNRIGRGPLVAVLLFGGTLFPALGFITVFPFRYSFVADHFQYHACLSILVAVCVWLTRAVPSRIGIPAAVVVLGLYGGKTWTQASLYEDRETLYNHILQEVPNSWFAHNNLAAIYVVRGEVEKGFASYKTTKELNPALHPGAHIKPEAYAHCMVGKMLANTHTLQPSIDAQRRGDINQSLSILVALKPQLLGVIEHFEKAIAINPGYTDALRDCGRVHEAIGLLTPNADGLPMLLEAVRLFGLAIKADPLHRDVRVRASNLHLQIAGGLERLGRSDEARAHKASARRLREGDPKF